MRTLLLIGALLTLTVSLLADTPSVPSAALVPGQTQALPKKLTVYFGQFTVDPYFAITPDNIRSHSQKFVMTSPQDIEDLYRCLRNETGSGQFDLQGTRLCIDPIDGSPPIFVDANADVLCGQRRYVLSTNNFLRLDHMLTFLLAQYQRTHRPFPAPKPPPSPPVVEAIWAGNYARFKALLDKKVSVQTRDIDGTPLLMIAVMQNSPPMVTLLLSREASPNVQAFGTPALIWAVTSCDRRIVKMLLDHGADINARDAEGRTALIYAAGAGFTDMTALLLDRKADMNLKTETGDIALLSAARLGRAGTVSLLLKHGADINQRNDEGENALQQAQEVSRDPATIKILQEWPR